MSEKKSAAKSNKSPGVILTRERMYEIIRSPVITEKATQISSLGQVTFRVPLDASKPEIKAAVEKLFNVKVEAVNTLIRKGKVRIFKGRPGELQNTKRAVVTLEEGHRIDVTTGL